jgi:hypothetical protein
VVGTWGKTGQNSREEKVLPPGVVSKKALPQEEKGRRMCPLGALGMQDSSGKRTRLETHPRGAVKERRPSQMKWRSQRALVHKKRLRAAELDL